MQRTIKVNLGERSYDVRIGPGELDRLGAAAAALPAARSAVVIADATVAELYGPRAVESLQGAGLTAAIIDFPAGEEHKTLVTFGHVTDELLAVSPLIDRDTLIVALGGGVTGDLAGFVAASALRGLRWIQCPTTLLADVDASVGGKTAVDHPAGKNLIGAFHQPSAVLIDVSVLSTLDGRQIRTGLAECVKHGMIRPDGRPYGRDATLLDFIDANAAAILSAQETVMTELVARNVAIKAAVVSADERESGERSHLNFGHTVGHAVETHLGLGKITHGEAVSLGMVAECRLAVTRRLCNHSVLERLEGLLKKLGLPVRWAGLDPAACWAIMQHDKKVRGGKVRMVLPTALGQVNVFNDIRESEVSKALGSDAQ
ncbi:MAG: 3-dehydroquinate synthase [Phycisphaerae bacterium]|nr:3-dehydroquinate synthase [Phycisphaerae bacterium]